MKINDWVMDKEIIEKVGEQNIQDELNDLTSAQFIERKGHKSRLTQRAQQIFEEAYERKNQLCIGKRKEKPS